MSYLLLSWEVLAHPRVSCVTLVILPSTGRNHSRRNCATGLSTERWKMAHLQGRHFTPRCLHIVNYTP